MRKLLGVAVLLAALMALGVAAAAADSGGTDRPFTGTLAGSATFPLDPSCPPVGRRTLSEGTGRASHLGLVSMTSSHCTPPGNELGPGQMTLVAANGDELHMTYTGTSTGPPFPAVGGAFPVYTHSAVVGGTGRFSDATGEADFTAHVTFAGFGVPVWPITWTWDGTLSY
jgi:hypothetical protein